MRNTKKHLHLVALTVGIFAISAAGFMLAPQIAKAETDKPAINISKTVNKTDIYIGDTTPNAYDITYTITASNNHTGCDGNRPLYIVTITDDLSSILPYVDFKNADDGITLNGENKLIWGQYYIGCKESLTKSFTVTVKNTTPDATVISNQATLNYQMSNDEGSSGRMPTKNVATTIHAYCGDGFINNGEQCDSTNGITGNQICSDTCTIIEANPVLSIIKTVDRTLTNPSSMLTYTVTVSNSGEGDAYMVELLDQLPAGFTFADMSFEDTTVHTWDLGTLAVGEDVTVKYDVLVDSNASAKMYDNIATVTASNYDGEVNDTASTEVHIPVVLVETAPALSIDKTVLQEFANPGSTITYSVEVTNTGDAVAYNALLDDTLPIGFVFVETGKRTHTWELGDLTPSESTTITYDVMVDASIIEGNYVNTAIAYADDVDKLSDEAVIEIRAVEVLGAEDEPTVLPVTGAGMLSLLATGAVAFGISIISRKRNA